MKNVDQRVHGAGVLNPNSLGAGANSNRYDRQMINFSKTSVSALLELHCDLLAPLRRREVVRSANNPTGDYGELLFSRAFGWSLNANSSADADATDQNGVRYQIKCRRLITPKGSR